MSAYVRPWWRGADPKDFTCPRCGAGPGWPCTPVRETGFATILRPHRQRYDAKNGVNTTAPAAPGSDTEDREGQP